MPDLDLAALAGNISFYLLQIMDSQHSRLIRRRALTLRHIVWLAPEVCLPHSTFPPSRLNGVPNKVDMTPNLSFAYQRPQM
jgi:hypothetical protein